MASHITVKIDDELLREARLLATEEGSSIDALLTEQLKRAIAVRREYQQARERARARLRQGFTLQWTPPRNRDELYLR